MFKFHLFSILLLFISRMVFSAPEMMLLHTYQNQNIDGWVMSEKLDGVRGYWDGKTLYSRQGLPLPAPSYFTKDFPPFAIDGELFNQRNNFDAISAITRSLKDKGWQSLKLYVFDVPDADGDLFARLAQLKDYLAQHPNPHIEIIEQIPIKSADHVRHFLQEIENMQGEGVIIRNPNAPYERKRSNQILKLKTTLDEECTVIAHHKGRGQFAEMLGAITCENHRGQFRIGSGFSIQQRKAPPPIGAVITYKYRGETPSGKPRFATYWRERKE